MKNIETVGLKSKGSPEEAYGIKPSMDPGVMLDRAVEASWWDR